VVIKKKSDRDAEFQLPRVSNLYFSCARLTAGNDTLMSESMEDATHWWRAAAHIHLTADEMCVAVEASDADESKDQSFFYLLLSAAYP
jgi:hypothetical protein